MPSETRKSRSPALLLTGLVVALLLIPAAPALAQYPPPTPTPTSTTFFGELNCTVEAGPDYLIISCTGEGFAPGGEVLVQVYGVGCTTSSAMLSPGLNAAPLPGEELLATETVTADDDGNIMVETTIGCCDLTALRIVATGPTADGDTLVLEDVIDDPALLACASGALSSTGFDWLRWLALGVWLVTAGVWIANVRDERTHSLAF